MIKDFKRRLELKLSHVKYEFWLKSLYTVSLYKTVIDNEDKAEYESPVQEVILKNSWFKSLIYKLYNKLIKRLK